MCTDWGQGSPSRSENLPNLRLTFERPLIMINRPAIVDLENCVGMHYQKRQAIPVGFCNQTIRSILAEPNPIHSAVSFHRNVAAFVQRITTPSNDPRNGLGG